MSQVPPAVPLAAPASAAARPPARQSWEALRVFARNPSAVAGVLLLAVILAVTIFGPMAMQADPFEIAGAPMSPPGEDALLGTDYLGRDVLTGMVYGGRATLLVGVVAAVLSMAIGLTVGALAGYYGGWIDSGLMRFTELFQAIPSFALAIVLVAIF